MAKRRFTKYPNSYVKASSESYDRPKSLSDFTEEEINALPPKFCVRTRIPGGNWGNKYTILSKEDFIKNPDECFWIDSYWRYAFSSDIYLVSRKQLDNYRQEKLQAMEEEKAKFLNQVNEYYRYAVD